MYKGVYSVECNKRMNVNRWRVGWYGNEDKTEDIAVASDNSS